MFTRIPRRRNPDLLKAYEILTELRREYSSLRYMVIHEGWVEGLDTLDMLDRAITYLVGNIEDLEARKFDISEEIGDMDNAIIQ